MKGKTTHCYVVVSLAYALLPVGRQCMINSRHWALMHCTLSMWTRNQWCCSLIMLVESFDTGWSTFHHCLSNKISSDRLFNSVQPSWRAANTSSVAVVTSGTAVTIKLSHVHPWQARLVHYCRNSSSASNWSLNLSISGCARVQALKLSSIRYLELIFTLQRTMENVANDNSIEATMHEVEQKESARADRERISRTTSSSHALKKYTSSKQISAEMLSSDRSWVR